MDLRFRHENSEDVGSGSIGYRTVRKRRIHNGYSRNVAVTGPKR